MGFVGLLDNKRIISLDYSDEEWKQLQLSSRKNNIEVFCPVSKTSMYLRNTKGTKHFVRKQKIENSNFKPESIQHLQLKEEIYNACKEVADFSQPEFQGKDWIADVYAQVNDKKFAFEVQLSKQSLEETRIRNEKYLRDGITCFWFFRNTPKDYEIQEFTNKKREVSVVEESLPMFTLYKENTILGYNIDIKDFIKNILNSKLEFKKSVYWNKKQDIDFYQAYTECWACGKTTKVIGTRSPYLTEEGSQMSYDEFSLSDDKIGEIVSNLQKEGKEELKGLGDIKKRYSKTVGGSYYSCGCEHCDAIQGEFFVSKLINDVMYENVKPLFSISIELDDEELLFTDNWPRWIIKS